MATPTQFKALKKYVREAKKLSKSQPGAAYYTLLYAVQTAMDIDAQSPEAKKFIGSLMDDMGAIKANRNCPSLDKEVQKVEIEELALRIFAMADEVDKRGEATKKTAQIFSSSYVLFEVLKQFGEREHEIAMKGKYALMKTGSILKALKDGVKPVAGVPEDKKSRVSRESGELPDPNSIGIGSGLPDPNSIGIGSELPDPNSIGIGSALPDPNSIGMGRIGEGDEINWPGAKEGITNGDGLDIGNTRDNDMSCDEPTSADQDNAMDFEPQEVPSPQEPSFFDNVSKPMYPPRNNSSLTLEELVNVCCDVEGAISTVSCSLRLKDATAAFGVIEEIIKTLKPYTRGGNWKPPGIPRQNKAETCEAVKIKMTHVCSALRFQDVYAALEILQQSAKSLAPFSNSGSTINLI